MLIRNMTLQGRIVLLVLGGLAVGLGLFSWLGVRSVNESIDRTLDERLTMARMMAGQVDAMLNYVLVELGNAAGAGTELFAGERFETTARSLRSTFDQLGIAGQIIVLTGADGETVRAHPADLEITAAEMLAQPTTKEALDHGVATISGLVSGPLSATPMVLISVPVTDDEGEIVGVLTCAIDIRQSSVALPGEGIALGRTGYAEIVDGNGLVLARTEPGTPPDALERSDHPDRFAALIAGGKATTGTCHRCHETAGEAVERGRDVLAFAPLSVTSWGVVIRQPEEEALAPTAQLGQRLIIVGIVVVVGTLVLVGVMMRSLVRPVRLLTSAAAKVAAGDFSVEIPVTRRDEIGQLSSAFRSMTQKLAASRDELVLRNQELRTYGAYVVRVHEDERQRLARELHDGTIQELMLLCHRLDDIERDAAMSPDAIVGLRKARSTAEEIVKDMRDFARSLRPPTLDDLGMVTSVRRLVRDLEERSEIRGRHKVVGEERRLPPDVELGMFRIAQEALRNIERHAEATRANVTISFQKDKVKLEVRDNGGGFANDGASGESGGGTRLGLVSMQERAELLGGTLKVQSGPRNGTRVTASIPISAGAAAVDEPNAA